MRSVKLKPIYSSLPKLFIGFILFTLTQRLKAQDIDGVHSFMVAGVSMDIPKNNKLLLYGGYSPTDNIKAFVALPNFKVHKYITLTPGYTYVNIQPENGPSVVENQILAMATVAIPVATNWTIADRNMYFHRFRKDLDDQSFYRNRLGVIHKAKLFKKVVSVFLYDEVFLSLDQVQFTRNRAIVGGDIKLLPWLTTQLMYMYQSDKTSGNRNLGWLILTVPLENFGLFKNDR